MRASPIAWFELIRGLSLTDELAGWSTGLLSGLLASGADEVSGEESELAGWSTGLLSGLLASGADEVSGEESELAGWSTGLLSGLLASGADEVSGEESGFWFSAKLCHQIASE
ncbi:MAG: hypothetical protein ACYDDZ_09695 [Acidimicrobiales bacterium]